jgi:hypothetical protein
VSRRRTTLAGALAGLGALAAAASAAATDGSLYVMGIGGPVDVVQSVPDDQCNARLDAGGAGVTCPPSAPALAGAKWQLDLRTRIPGTMIEALSVRAVRHHETPTSIALQVLADGAPVWGVAERDIPRHPAPPKPYLVGFRAGTGSLRLFQTETRQQPNRVWTLLEPRIHVRDVQPPLSTLESVPGSWITGTTADIEWSVLDNFGTDGIGAQRLYVGNRPVWAGAPGQGIHAATLDLAGIPDGAHQLRLEADGDGTPPAADQTAVLRIDRAAPAGTLDVVPLAGERVRLVVSVADGASGVRRWTLHARNENNPSISFGSASRSEEVDLSGLASPGEAIRFFARVVDHAGHTTTIASPAVVRAAVPIVLAGSDARLGPPGQILAAGGPLPNFSRVGAQGLKSEQARRYGRTGRQLVPVVVARYGRPVSLRGRFFHPNRRGLRGATVYLVDPLGRAHGTTLTDLRGRFSFRPRPKVPGVWRAIALGRPLVVSPAVMVVRPFVRVRVRDRFLAPGETVRVAGVIRPRTRSRGKVVQLQWRQGDAWRPLDQVRADRTGRFRLSFRLSSLAGGYSIRMRVVVPREKGWTYAPVVAKRFRVAVA